jgi:hypothetical protein
MLKAWEGLPILSPQNGRTLQTQPGKKLEVYYVFQEKQEESKSIL